MLSNIKGWFISVFTDFILNYVYICESTCGYAPMNMSVPKVQNMESETLNRITSGYV